MPITSVRHHPAAAADHRRQHLPRALEERANALSHALAALMALAALPVLAAADVPAPPASRQMFGLAVFLGGMAVMYAISALYHALPVGPAKRTLRRWDHAVIFVFIAASGTPFLLIGPSGGSAEAGWRLLLVWLLALAGLWLKLTLRLRQPMASTVVYLGFGWLVALVAWPAVAQLPESARAWLFIGGVSYTAGSGFFLLGLRRRFGHLAWHLLAAAGSAAHLAAVWQALRGA